MAGQLQLNQILAEGPKGTVASLAAGMTVSAVRWAILDALHARLGLRPPALDFSRLAGKVEAFQLLIEIHYRHYQFYANVAVASAIAWGAWRAQAGNVGAGDLAFVVLEAVFLATSRDTLRKYYERTRQLLAAPTSSSRVASRASRRTPAASSRGR